MNKVLPALAMALLLTGCANSPYHDPQDPYESYNRTVYQINDDLYNYVATPINTVYLATTPTFVRTGITNAFTNVGTVPDMGNDLLQGNWRFLIKDTTRLVLNTTLGLFGLIDVAGAAGIPDHQQDFAYTLAVWGWKDSSYFIIPFIGPNTVSGAFSLAPNYFMSPLTYFNGGAWQYGLWAFNGLQTISNQLPTYDVVNATALDPYIAIRTAYEQNRQYVLQQIMSDGTMDTDSNSTPSDSGQLSPIMMMGTANS